MLWAMGMIWVAYRRDHSAVHQLMEDPDEVEELLESDDDETSVDIDKAWHGIHWLLTGSEAPTAETPSDVIFGGEPFGEDLGYGPARLLSIEGVGRVAQVLERVDADALRVRMDPAAMQRAGVYPEIWDEEDVLDEYLLPALRQLRIFYDTAAKAGQAVIQTLC
jgi:Domain of unknown function (DUF1877)